MAYQRHMIHTEMTMALRGGGGEAGGGHGLKGGRGPGARAHMASRRGGVPGAAHMTGSIHQPSATSCVSTAAPTAARLLAMSLRWSSASATIESDLDLSASHTTKHSCVCVWGGGGWEGGGRGGGGRCA